MLLGGLIMTTDVNSALTEYQVFETSIDIFNKNEQVNALEEVITDEEDKTVIDEVVEEEEKLEVVAEEPKVEVKTTPPATTKKQPVNNNVSTVSKDVTMFVGKVTHYGPDCNGCSGVTASGYNVKNTIYYNDPEFGSVRIVAGPKEVPLYSILTLHNYKGDPITVIVLDRGGAIKGTKFDILVSSESEAIQWGIQNNVEFEILRWGR